MEFMKQCFDHYLLFFFNLCRTGRRDGDDLQVVNIGVNMFIATVLVPLSRRAWAWYEARRDQNLKRIEHERSEPLI